VRLCGEICESSIVTLRTLSLFYSWADLSICKAFYSTCTHFDGMCLAGLSCSVSCVIHITVTFRNVIKIWMENQFDNNVSVSFCHFEFEAVSSAVFMETFKTTNRNRHLLT
jgi:hypothetical protein